MSRMSLKKEMHLKRKRRVRKGILGTEDRPRLTVFRSAKHIYAQIVVDTQGRTLVSACSAEKEVREQQGLESKVAVGEYVGKLLAQRARGKGITKVVFDRNGFLYHGRVRAVSAGAREGGLDF